MELLTQKLPSGYPYPFNSIHLEPMYFAQILEYLDAVPSQPVEKFYFDYCTVKDDDPNIQHLLLCDLDYVIFFKKGLTISENVEYNTYVKCPYCGADVEVHFSVAEVEFAPLDPKLHQGIKVEIGGKIEPVRMPTVGEFMRIFGNYRRYKRVTDMKLIKLVALFRNAYDYQQAVEDLVIHSKYNDITMLSMLDQLFYSSVKPYKAICTNCTDIETNQPRGMEISLDGLISNFFRTIIENNGLASSKIIFGEAGSNT